MAPRSIYPAIPVVIGKLGLDAHDWWFVEMERARELPKHISKIAASMREKVMALRLPLSPVAEVVYVNNAVRSRHANQDAQINE